PLTVNSGPDGALSNNPLGGVAGIIFSSVSVREGKMRQCHRRHRALMTRAIEASRREAVERLSRRHRRLLRRQPNVENSGAVESVAGGLSATAPAGGIFRRRCAAEARLFRPEYQFKSGLRQFVGQVAIGQNLKLRR